eukprot:353077-Chlamydomonas_euryale.AAC.2
MCKQALAVSSCHDRGASISVEHPVAESGMALSNVLTRDDEARLYQRHLCLGTLSPWKLDRGRGKVSETGG